MGCSLNIAKSVRSNGSASSGSEENADDFLGCINIPLNEIPVVGYDTWFKLEPRSSASKVQGECHLILKLFTSQVCLTELPIFNLHLREPYNWNGQVSPPAWTVLTHHAVQTDLSPLQQLLTDIHQGFWFSQKCLTAGVLEAITEGPSCVQERQLSDSFRLYTEHCLCLMKNMRQVFPCTSAAAITLYYKHIVSCFFFVCLFVFSARDAKMLALTGFHNWFKSSIHKWLQIVHDRSCDRIRRAVDKDKLEPVQQAKHSSSAVEVTACFSQVREIWFQLAWPDSAGAFIFVTRLTDVSATFNALCIALNNTEHVRVFLAMEESCGAEGKEQVYKALNGQLYNMDLDLQREAKHLITLLTDKMLPELRRYIQHISLSPDSINNDDAVSPLMKYLHDTMVILTATLVKENLARVLQSLWELLLRMILDTITENRGVQVEFYNRFQYTVETLLQFFHAKGDGLALEDMKSGDYKVLEEELKLNKCSSFELIEQYFLEKISHQKTLKHTRFGRISVKCYYDAPEQRLTVEILHAADIIALDANGLSDPFVIVELCPHHLFPMAKSQPAPFLPFPAVAPLSDFCWPGRPNASAAGKSVQPVILHLSRNKPSGTYTVKPIMRMLDARIGDREAQEFVRRLKEIEKSMEEE
uniref:BAI1 associated protein 3 n=1 Tax=Myripristis murdjan TaxID=586833 RepID=A0A668AUP9_9TELE